VLSNKLLDGVSKLNPSCFEVPQALISEFQGLIQSREGDFFDNRRARTDKKRYLTIYFNNSAFIKLLIDQMNQEITGITSYLKVWIITPQKLAFGVRNLVLWIL
jgi:hypothetical protein